MAAAAREASGSGAHGGMILFRLRDESVPQTHIYIHSEH
jgi:hypothetical protein